MQAGVVKGLQIQALTQDNNFAAIITDQQKAAWVTFQNAMQNFLERLYIIRSL